MRKKAVNPTDAQKHEYKGTLKLERFSAAINLN